MTLSAAVVAFVIMTFASVLQGAVGFGTNLIATPLLLLLYPPMVPVSLLIAGVLRGVMVLYRDWPGADWPGLARLTVGLVPGALAGAWMGMILQTNEVRLGAAVVIVAGVAITALGWALPRRTVVLVVVGGFAALMQVTAAVGGPAVALLYQDTPGKVVRATMAANFVVAGTLSLASLALVGRVGRSALVPAVILVAASAVGVILSSRLTGAVDRGRVRPLVLAVAALSGLAALVHGALGMV